MTDALMRQESAFAVRKDACLNQPYGSRAVYPAVPRTPPKILLFLPPAPEWIRISGWRGVFTKLGAPAA
jgi:hypothetical protein